jgi:hypothetical protein
MFATRPRALIAALALTAATALAATMAGPVQASPGPGYTPPPSTSGSPTTPVPFYGLRVTAITPGSVTLAWTPVDPGCCDFRISYSQAFDDIYRAKDVGRVSSATITEGINSRSQYSFTVFAAGYSAYLTVMTPAGTTGDVTPPTKPTGLTNLGQTPEGSQLTWTASTDDVGVVGYNVYFFDGWYTSLVVATSTGTSAVAQSRAGGLQNGSFYVRARDAAGNLSIASDTVKAPPPTSVPPSTSASASPPPGSTCAFEYRVTNRWNGGFAVTWKLTNTGSTPITGWSVSLQFSGDERLSEGWSAVYAQIGQALTLGDLSWNRVIPPGGSANGGFLAWGNSTTAPPSSATLAGRACLLT